MHCRTLIVLLVAAWGSVANAQTKVNTLPVLGSAPETDAQFGIALLRTTRQDDSLGTRPSLMMGNFVFTSKSQARGFIERDAWSPGNVRRSLFTAVFSLFPLPYHGVGDDTPDSSTVHEPLMVDLSLQRHRLRAADRWRYVGARLVTSHPKTKLIPVANSCAPPSCGLVAPALHSPLDDFGRPVTSLSYTMLMLTAGSIHDSRDNVLAPRSGRVLDLSVGVAGVDLEWRRGAGLFGRYQADARWYRETARGSVWAAQALVQGNDGDAPIDQLALLGNNSINRGYTMGRYRDHWMAATQLEWRSPHLLFSERLGVAAFGSVASLGHEIGELFAGRALPAAGAGLRFRLDRDARSSVRLDYARGRSGQSGLYLAFNEAF